MLQVDDLHVQFGGIVAVSGLTFGAASGEITGLIGPNGAGKTTSFNVISGLQRPDRGRIALHGTDITNASPQRRAKLGMARTFQRLELFGSLTVLENIQTAVETAGHSGSARAIARDVLGRVGLEAWADRSADDLPTGTGRLLEVGRAIAGKPRLLLLDEPGAGLSEAEVVALGDLLKELAADGLAVLLVEHDMELVMRVCDSIVVLDNGSLLATGSPKEVAEHPAVQAAYLGAAVEASA